MQASPHGERWKQDELHRRQAWQVFQEHAAVPQEFLLQFRFTDEIQCSALTWCDSFAVGVLFWSGCAANGNSTEMIILEKQRMQSKSFQARGTSLISVSRVDRKRRDPAQCKLLWLSGMTDTQSGRAHHMSELSTWLGDIRRLFLHWEDVQHRFIQSPALLSSVARCDADCMWCSNTTLLNWYFYGISISWKLHCTCLIGPAGSFPWTPLGILKVPFLAGVNSWLGMGLAVFIADT